MKRGLLCLVVLAGAAALGGCPIYSNQNDYRVCDGTTCYDCPDPGYSSMCVPWSCSTDSDCGSGYTCNTQGQCASSSSEDAGSSSPPPADCSTQGCPAGQVCKLAGGVAACAPFEEDAAGPSFDATAGQPEDATSGVPDAAAEGTTPEAGIAEPAEGAVVSEAGGPIEAGQAETGPLEASTVEAGIPTPCNADGDCAVGAYCIDGACTPQSQLCSDGSQCAAAGESCVNGVCVPFCSASSPCPSGYGCDFTLGVCDLNPAPCTGSGTSGCQGGAVCVESRCVPPCGPAGGESDLPDVGSASACPAGQVCVNGGCIPDQAALFSCRNDGASGDLANTCATTSICLHHDCYPACNGEAGACPSGQECKQVTVTAGTYAVCGTASTLGSDCDLAAGAPCTGSGVCVDGYCR